MKITTGISGAPAPPGVRARRGAVAGVYLVEFVGELDMREVIWIDGRAVTAIAADETVEGRWWMTTEGAGYLEGVAEEG